MSYIVTGMCIGDEGKGSATDFLANKINARYLVRHNGGSQAHHTVINGNIKHKFSQLGSAFMNENVITYLSGNTIVNPFNLITEADVYNRETNIDIDEILNRVYISKNARVVTPYHAFINKIRELSLKEAYGTTGTGVSEVKRIFDETGIEILMSDLLDMDEATWKLRELQNYTAFFFDSRRQFINTTLYRKLIDQNEVEKLTTTYNKDYIINCYKNLMDSDLINTSPSFKELYTSGEVVFEGSQGILLDKDYGIRPNVSEVDTTSKYAYQISKDIQINPISIGCVPVYNSRHGAGILPTYDKELNDLIHDENQTETYFQGIPTYGWMDLVLLRYSLKVNQTDEIFLTMLDRYYDIPSIKICTSYRYYGEVTEEFTNTFEYYIDNDEVIIKDIKRNNERLKEYLLKTKPIYKMLKGYKNIDEADELIECIEKELDKKVSYISYGADRSMKLERKIS